MEEKGRIIKSTWFFYICEFSSGRCQT